MKNPFLFSLFIFICGCGVDNKSISESKKDKDTAIDIEDDQKTSEKITINDKNIVDSNLILFCQKRLTKKGNFTPLTYKYKVFRDTLFIDYKDSIIIYQYPIDSICNYYKFPYEWSGHYRTQEQTEIITNVDEFANYCKTAELCQGIIYENGDQMLESLRFSNSSQAEKAKKLFDATNYYTFPKTLSFACTDSNYLYVFHARYMGPSWYSKKDYEWFLTQL